VLRENPGIEIWNWIPSPLFYPRAEMAKIAVTPRARRKLAKNPKV
jgi:hypothetical protein